MNPGLFALIKYKKEEGYQLLFHRIKNIITKENTYKLNLES